MVGARPRREKHAGYDVTARVGAPVACVNLPGLGGRRARLAVRGTVQQVAEVARETSQAAGQVGVGIGRQAPTLEQITGAPPLIKAVAPCGLRAGLPSPVPPHGLHITRTTGADPGRCLLT